MKGQVWRVLIVGLGCALVGMLSVRQIVAAPLAECVPAQIKISEVESDAPTAFGTDSDNEWVELTNLGVACTLTNWVLADNTASDTIPSTNLGAGGRLIVAATSSFTTTHPTFTGAIVVLNSPLGSGLADGGDVVRLRDSGGVEADCMSWGSNVSCLNPAVPQNTANTTATYQRTPTDVTDTDTRDDWTSATETPQGTPTAVALSALTARAELFFDYSAWVALGALSMLGVILWRIRCA